MDNQISRANARQEIRYFVTNVSFRNCAPIEQLAHRDSHKSNVRLSGHHTESRLPPLCPERVGAEGGIGFRTEGEARLFWSAHKPLAAKGHESPGIQRVVKCEGATV